MSDTQQTESGADVNALRNNFEVGDSKVLTVKNLKQIDAETWVVTAEVEEGDNDTDTCKSEGGYEPTVGEKSLFVRTEAGMVISPAPAEDTGSAEEAKPEGTEETGTEA